jgi:hypothetical protein
VGVAATTHPQTDTSDSFIGVRYNSNTEHAKAYKGKYKPVCFSKPLTQQKHTVEAKIKKKNQKKRRNMIHLCCRHELKPKHTTDAKKLS